MAREQAFRTRARMFVGGVETPVRVREKGIKVKTALERRLDYIGERARASARIDAAVEKVERMSENLHDQQLKDAVYSVTTGPVKGTVYVFEMERGKYGRARISLMDQEKDGEYASAYVDIRHHGKKARFEELKRDGKYIVEQNINFKRAKATSPRIIFQGDFRRVR